MLDLALIRAEPARVKAALARRGVGPEAVDKVADLDARWAERGEVCEALRLRRRRVAEEVARAKARGRDSSELQDAGRAVGGELAAAETQLADLEARRLEAILAVPNLPATDTPDRPAEPARPEPAPAWPKPFAPLPHWHLLSMAGLARTADPPGPGRGFLIWRGRGARLVRAIIDFLLDIHIREFGCEEVRVPAIATRAALTGSAHLPLLEDKMYPVNADGPQEGAAAAGRPPPPVHAGTDLFLSPRGEPHLANLYAGRVLDAAALPVRLVSAGPAFRREASAGGTAGSGLLRLHQFDTVELYTFTRHETGDEELARAVQAAETAIERLGVPFRRSLRPAPLLSHAAAKTVDLEVWAPGMPAEEKGEGEKGSDPFSARGRWLPVAAISSFADYQARRTNTRYRDEHGHVRLVHTLGGAAVALPHLIAAIVENNQESDGSIRLPAALEP